MYICIYICIFIIYIYTIRIDLPAWDTHCRGHIYIGEGGTYNNIDDKNDDNMRARTNTMMVLNAALSFLFLVLVSLS